MLEGLTWYKQAGYRWQADGVSVYVDPWEVTGEPVPADAIFLTHAHYDHYSPDDIGRLRKDGTVIVAPHDIAAELTGNIEAVAPGDTVEVAGVKAQAVPAYNIVEERLDKHPKANNWVGYVLDLGGVSHYFAGDTDALPELESLPTQIALVPIGGTYTMDVPEAAGLVQKIAPDIAVPNHYGYVCGTAADAERFREAAAPVRVEILSPEHPFEEPGR